MAQQEYIPKGWIEEQHGSEDKVTLKSSETEGLQCTFTFEILSETTFRTTFTSPNHPLPPYPACAVPKQNGSKYMQITSNSTVNSRTWTVNSTTQISLSWDNTPEVSICLLSPTGNPTAIYADLPLRSYAIDGPGTSHYTAFQPHQLHAGLGEKAAPFDLSHRGFRIAATDAFGYNANSSDPLYKHIPLLIAAGAAGCVAQFSASHARAHWSVGAEMDGLWGRYKVLRQQRGGLEEYIMVGHKLADLTRTYAELVGFPRMPPRWALGYLAGGMKYSMLDDPPAQEALEAFAKKLEEHDIPCSGFQLSSGYTVSKVPPKTRNVFTWNKHRFSDPEGWVRGFRERGIRVLANVKPYVLKNHPAYEKLKSAGALFTDPRTGETAVTRLWSAGGGESGEGSHIDFTSAAGFQWWYDGVQSLRRIGIEGIWNDNNEYTIPDDGWRGRLDLPQLLDLEKGRATNDDSVGIWGRAMHTELMAHASHDAVLDLFPGERPFVLTRSATAGTMRYAASSWSGDNVTSWASMRASTALSLNAGLSLIPCYGHDIGGFEGPQPTPELLLRWIQLGVYAPRFAINCFKTSPDDNSVGDVIEPWMYPSITALVRAAIRRRYALIPFLYSLLLESSKSGAPVQRWVGWGCEGDDEVWSNEKLRGGEGQFWVGDALIIGSVGEPGAERVQVYLPKRDEETGGGWGYCNLNAPYQRFEAGKWVEIECPWESSIPVLGRIGSFIPTGRVKDGWVGCHDDADYRTLWKSREDGVSDHRLLEIFPPLGDHHDEVFRQVYYKDDGISNAAEPTKYSFEYRCVDGRIEISVGDGIVETEHSNMSQVEVWAVLPPDDKRAMVRSNGTLLKSEHASVYGMGPSPMNRCIWHCGYERVIEKHTNGT